MRKCRYTAASRSDKIGAFFVYPLAALLVLIADMYFIYLFFNGLFYYSSKVKLGGFIGLVVVIMAISRLLYFLGWLCYQSSRMENRMFSLSAEGVTLGYSKEKTSFYAWNEISEIGISAFQASASREAYQTVICIFLEPKHDDFIQGILTLFYGLKNMDQFVLIDYSEEIYAQLASVYHKKLEDYRPQQVR